MAKGIIFLIIIGAVLYAFFGIWGIIIPVVAIVGLIVLIIKSVDENNGNSHEEEEWEVEYREMAKSYGWNDERINKLIQRQKKTEKRKARKN
jgi:hypothetical protein